MVQKAPFWLKCSIWILPAIFAAICLITSGFIVENYLADDQDVTAEKYVLENVKINLETPPITAIAIALTTE